MTRDADPFIFLGGACGTSTWRRDLAIPALQAAGVAFFNPQLGPGEWTPAHEPAELSAKAQAAVLLFVIDGASRGVASLTEAAFLIGSGRPLVLLLGDIPAGTTFEGQPVGEGERRDLNRGRHYLRTLARQHGIQVHDEIEAAIQAAVRMVQG